MDSYHPRKPPDFSGSVVSLESPALSGPFPVLQPATRGGHQGATGGATRGATRGPPGQLTSSAASIMLVGRLITCCTQWWQPVAMAPGHQSTSVREKWRSPPESRRSSLEEGRVKEFWDGSAAPGLLMLELPTSEAQLEDPFRPDVHANLVAVLSARRVLYGRALGYYGLFLLSLGRHCCHSSPAFVGWGRGPWDRRS